MVQWRIRSVLRIALTAFVCLTLALFSVLQLRYGAALLGLIDTPQADALEYESSAEKASLPSHVTISAEYCSEVIVSNDPSDKSGKTATPLYFDDDWFDKDSYSYNHDLATSCAILSAVCNSESQFYGDINGAEPYVEKTLSNLGFSNIRTDSYALRSNSLDQIAAFFVSSHDVAAYAFATKTIPGKKGEGEQTLVFVGIRGSYGIEWLSNFKMITSDENNDHLGFELAENEVAEALEEYLEEIDAKPENTKILITGHSRGGSIANLLAADLDTRSNTSDSLASVNNIYAYTFASPGTTQANDCCDDLYGNIYNIVNPSDVVPHLPLSTWDFGKYGSTVTLPNASDADFSPAYEAMQEAHKSNTGYYNQCCVEDLKKLNAFNADAGTKMPSLGSIASPQGIGFAFEMVTNIDASTVCYAHYPDTYIAWMQSIEPEQLVIG